MSTPQKFDTARLACTATEGAKAKEAAYHEAYKGAPLRGKYRVGGTTYTKGSNKGSGNAGTAKHKVPHIGQAPPVEMVKVVDARSGKSRFIPAAGATK